MNDRRGKDRARPRDLWVPWLIAAGFGVVILVNGVMVYFAVTSFTGLQTEGHYQRGLEYNEVLAGARAQDALGWVVGINFDQTGDGVGRLSVQATDKAGDPLNDAGVTVRLVRPVQAGYDMDLTLAAAGNGLYAADVELPLRGQWDILAQIRHPSGSFSTAKRIVAQ
ncbi:MAG: FixH family protein [Alphaproteobacteria bacterium]